MTTPITLTPDQVRAALNGRLAEIRIPIDPIWVDGANPEFTGWHAEVIDKTKFMIVCTRKGATGTLPHAVGDLLWCREEWSGEHVFRNQKPNDRQDFIADGWPYFRKTIHYWADGEHGFGDWERPRSPVQMPKWASRLTLKVQRVRVERLYDITEAGAIACGIEKDPEFDAYFGPEGQGVVTGSTSRFSCAREAYFSHWRRNHAKPGQSVKDNPWVVVYGVEVIKQNVEELERQSHES